MQSSIGCKIKTARKQHLCKAFTEGVQLSVMQIGDEEGTLLHSLTTRVDHPTLPVEVENLLGEFEDVFQEPQQLPSLKPRHDHQIPLIQGANPVNKRHH